MLEVLLRWLHPGGTATCWILRFNGYICDGNRAINFSIILIIGLLIGLVGSYTSNRIWPASWLRGLAAILCLVLSGIVIVFPNIAP